MSSFVERLRKAIEKSGETQNSLARKGVAGQTTIGTWLKGRNPRPEALGRLVKALRINGHWLLTEEGDMHVLQSGGGDELFEAGLQAGLARAEAVFRSMRTTSELPNTEMHDDSVLPPDDGESGEDRGEESA